MHKLPAEKKGELAEFLEDGSRAERESAKKKKMQKRFRDVRAPVIYRSGNLGDVHSLHSPPTTSPRPSPCSRERESVCVCE